MAYEFERRGVNILIYDILRMSCSRTKLAENLVKVVDEISILFESSVLMLEHEKLKLS